VVGQRNAREACDCSAYSNLKQFPTYQSSEGAFVIGQPISGKPVVGLQDLKGRNLPHFGPYAKERANIIANMKQVSLLQYFSQYFNMRSYLSIPYKHRVL
jgi:hypothetical protein